METPIYRKRRNNVLLDNPKKRQVRDEKWKLLSIERGEVESTFDPTYAFYPFLAIDLKNTFKQNKGKNGITYVNY